MQYLKITLIALFIQALSLSSNAQSPDLINYQAVAYNSAGSVASSQAISVRISILQGSTSGAIVYQETHNPATDVNGAFDLQIGGGSVQSGSFGGISWGSFSHYLRVEMDVNGGTNYSVMGTSQMVSVPYAKYAETAGSVGGSSPLEQELGDAFFRITSTSSSQSGSTFEGYFSAPDLILTSKLSKTNPNTIVLGSMRGILKLTINPSTLTITSGTAIGYGIVSSSSATGTISSDYNTINLNYTVTDGSGGGVGTSQCTLTLTRQ
ncbi:MAG: hypothetical protein GY810_26090 [Aureispira sp.]|nr:hypothetical protein [Aureispira sp.]